MSYNSTIVEDGATNLSACLDAHKYNSVWSGGEATSSVQTVIDLGSEKEIFQTAIKPKDICKLSYKIEISSNGTDYVEYAMES